MEKKYTITVNEKQLKALSHICDMYSRIICGQLDLGMRDRCESAWERDHKNEDGSTPIGSEDWYAMRNEVEYHLNALKKLCWDCDKNCDYGIGYDDYADMLYDMHQVMRHEVWKENGEKSYTVDAYEPLKHGKEELIDVKRV